MTVERRMLRARVLEFLESRAKQFRARDDTYPFRVPHEPLPLDELIAQALDGTPLRLHRDELRARPVIGFHWNDGAGWDAWVIALPSGLHLFCDTDAGETRVLASLKRGSPLEADRFFLELLAESRGHAFGIETAGAPPDTVRTPLTEREFLVDVFVDLYEGTPAQAAIHARAGFAAADFRTDVALWLDRVLVARPHTGPRRHVRRLRDEP